MNKNDAIGFIADEIENGLDALEEQQESEHGGWEETYTGLDAVLAVSIEDLMKSESFKLRLEKLLVRIKDRIEEINARIDDESEEEDEDEDE